MIDYWGLGTSDIWDLYKESRYAFVPPDEYSSDECSWRDLRRGYDKYRYALDFFNSLLAHKTSDHILALANKAWILLILGEEEEAIKCCNIVLKRSRKKLILTTVSCIKGMLLAQDDLYKEAIECFDKAINWDKEYFFAYIAKGDILGNMGDLKGEIENYNLASQIIEKKESECGYLEKWEELTRDVLNNYIDKVSTVLAAEKKLTEAKIEKVGEEKNEVDKKIQSGKGEPKTSNLYRNALAAYTKALESGLKNDYIGAIKLFDEVLKKKPMEHLDALFHKGELLFEIKDYDRAIECFITILKVDNKNPFAYTYKGDALKAQGKFRDAIECYNRAIRINDRFAIAYHHKARALKEMGLPKKAFDSLKLALKFYGGKGNGCFILGVKKEIEVLEAEVKRKSLIKQL